MRLEYEVQLADIEVPRFAVEAVEGIGKLFTLATLVLNVLETKPEVEIVFQRGSCTPQNAKRSVTIRIEARGG